MQLQALVLLLCALYGSVFVFGKLTLEYAPPLFITAARMILASFLLLGYQFFFRRSHFIFKSEHVWPIVIIGFTNVYLTNAFEFWGLQFMEAGKACFLYSFTPIATALLSYVLFSEKITLKQAFGLSLGVLGFLPILLAHSTSEDKSGYFFLLSYAELAILAAAVTTAIGWIVMRQVVKKHNYSSVMANGMSMLIGGVMALVHSAWTEDWEPTPITDFENFIGWFVALTLVSNILSYNLNTVLLRYFSATYLSFAGLSQPFFAALFGWLLLWEVMSVYFWLSLFLVSIGLYVYYQDELKHVRQERIKTRKKQK